jgi:uncharacterized protein (DUF736 family)
MEQKNNSGTIFRNAKKETAQAPDYSGTATVGEKKYRIAGWINKSKTGANYLRVLFTEVVEQPQAGLPAEQSRLEMGSGNVDSVMIDDLPF